MMEENSEILKRLQHRGYTVVQPGEVSETFLNDNSILACKGQMFWHLMINSRENRVIQKRWEQDHVSKKQS